MNKTKKIATAVVSLVLAATMCMSIAACSSSEKRQPKDLTQSQELLDVSTDGDGNLSYTSGTELNMNVGYNTNNNMSISYTSANLSGSVKMPDGNSYSVNSLKPAWQSLQDKLDVKFTDSYGNLSATAQITSNLTDGSISSYNVITAQSSTIVTEGTADEDLFLDLSLYLDYMPNYKKFLQDNPIVYMSLTSDTDSGAMYYAPYFDGNDDIEKYEIAKKNWVTRVLDSTYTSSNTISFAESVSSKASVVGSTYGLESTASSVESFMGTTGSWWVESTDPDDETKTVTIVVNYDDALTAAKSSSTALGSALSNAGVTISNLTSGNIVDLQNAAINANNGAVTGAQLTEILRAYIDVAYQDEDGNKYYSTRGDVFNGLDAAWDVDLLVALMRCIVTFGNTNLGTDSANADIYGLSGRQGNSQRESDMYSLAGELYGVRGFTSRYNFTYIDSTGTLQEARANSESYEALDKMHDMAQEGLLNLTGKQSANKTSYYTAAGTPEVFMIYDYVQTQTANGGYSVMGISTISTLESDYDFEPIVTPVSKWNDGTTETTKENCDGITYKYDSDGNKYMRFTESWRSVKNTGFCVPYDSVKNDSEKLAAVLAFIDYFFSNDGQILMSFGGQSSTNNATTAVGNYTGTSDDGWWYAEEVTGVSISSVATMTGGQYYIDDEYAAEYFCYNNKLYTGTYYSGKQYPTMTNTNLAFYYGYSVNGVSQNTSSGFGAVGVLSYTNYARYQIGAALPIGNKLQAFEFQCTSDQGIAGGNIVAAGLTNGTISHVYQIVGDDNGKGYWYTIVPTTLPYTTTRAEWISTNVADTLDGSVFANSSSISTNFFIDVIKYGLGNSNCICTYISSTTTMPATGAACVSLLNTNYKLNTYLSYMQEAWTDISGYYDDYISLL